MKRINYFILLFLALSVYAYAQMPPHPDLLKRIKNGELDKSILENHKGLHERGIDAPWSETGLNKSNAKDGTGRMYGPASPCTGKVNALVILVQFPDNLGQDDPANFDSVLFSHQPGSLNSFYKENSYNQVDMTTQDMPSKIGWIMAPHPYSYYVGTGEGMGSYPRNSQGLVEDIVKIVDSLIDFSKYDNKNNRKVDALFIVHAGPGAEFTGSKSTQIWSHAWSTVNTITLDGVNISRYSIEPEYMSKPGDASIGVFCHELGHALYGLPDLYDTDYTSNGVGNWSLMAGGSWNGPNGYSPAHFDAWCKIQCGFLTPKTIPADTLGLNIPNIENSPIAYKVWKNGVVGSEYFLIENRQKVGFDSKLPGSGMLLYHVDESQSGNTHEWYPGHTSSGHYKVALIQADGNYELEKNSSAGDIGDPYPGLYNHNSSFSAISSPSSLDYNFNFTNVSLQNIASNSGVITLDAYITDNLNPATRSIVFTPYDLALSADTTWLNLSNTGNGSIGITKIENKNSAFSIVQSVLPQNIAAGKSVMIGVVFHPSSIGEFTDTLTISRTNSLLNTIYIALSGRSYIMNKAAEKTIYAVSNTYNSGNFLTLNKNTGAGTNVGPTGFVDITSVAVNPKTKIIYGVNAATTDSSKIVKINPVLGDAYTCFNLKTGNMVGIAFDTAGTLYGISKAGGIYTIDLAKGTDTLIAAAKNLLSAIAFDPTNNQMWGAQYAIVGSKDKIYTVTPNTGECTLVGRTGLTNASKGLFFDETGKLYAAVSTGNSADIFIQIDKTTGVGDTIGSIGITGVTGLAYLPGSLTDVKTNSKVTPNSFELSQNYPNPFNPSTVIRYNIPESGNVKLTVYNILGKEVKTLFEGNKNAGNYQINWNSENSYGGKVSSGVYFYELKFNSASGKSFSAIKKMILIK